MADAVVEFAANTQRWKRDLNTIERDAQKTALSIEQSFRAAESRGFGMGGDFRSQRIERLRVEREINQRVESEFRESLDRQVRDYAEGQERLANRTRIYAERQSSIWEDSARRRAQTLRLGSQVGRGALMGLTATFAIADRAASGFTDRFEYMGDYQSRWRQEISRSSHTISRELVPAMQWADRVVASAIGHIESFRSAMVDTATNAVRGDTMYSERQRAMFTRIESEEMDRRRSATFERERLTLTGQGGGPEAEAAKKRLERQAYASQLKAQVAAGELTGSQASDLMAVMRSAQAVRAPETSGAADAAARADREAMLDISAMSMGTRAARMRAAGRGDAAELYEIRGRAALDVERLPESLTGARRTQVVDAINAGRDAKIEEATRAQAERARSEEAQVQSAREMYELRSREWKIDGLIAAGKEREAKIAREALYYERERAALLANEAIDDRAKGAYLEQLDERHRAQLDSITRGGGGDARSVRMLSSGLGSDPVLRRQALGFGGNIANQQLAEARKQTDLLGEIAEKAGMYA